jgi:dephospho-CoA kinase
MFLVGLTGGIASGKSTVAELWDSLGAEVIDADQLAREVVEPGTPALQELAAHFGPEILNSGGELDRKSLANLVFTNPDERKFLEATTHPRIKALALSKIEASKANIVVYVIPLLVESKSDVPFDYVVTVEAPELDQIQRIVSSRGMTAEEALARIRSQTSPAERANASDRILSSNQSLKLLLTEAKLLWNEIERLARAKGEN